MIQAGTDFFAFPAFERRSLYARCLFLAIFLYSPYCYVPLRLLALYLSEQLLQDFVCDRQSNAPRLRYLYELQLNLSRELGLNELHVRQSLPRFKCEDLAEDALLLSLHFLLCLRSLILLGPLTLKLGHPLLP